MSEQFRKTFRVVSKTALRWFPGHMGSGLRKMQQQLKNIDCIIEVHDARIPLSGRNPQFKQTVSGLKPHILALNKKDLGEVELHNTVAEKIKANEGIDHVVYTNCKDQQCNGIRKLMPMARQLILSSNRFNRADQRDLCVMVIGVPNVGKSSLLNVLRNRHLKAKAASAVGGVAGITRSVLNKIKISEDPLIYMVDTPGILEPRIQDNEVGMKLALCGCLQDHLVGADMIADYLLYWLNQNKKFEYVELMDVEEGPTDSIEKVLISGAKKFNKYKKMKNFEGRMLVVPDYTYAADQMIRAFRTGYFGKINLDKNHFR